MDEIAATEIPEATGETPTGQAEPTLHQDPATGLLTLSWNGDRPDTVLVHSDLLDKFVAERNEMLTLINGQQTVLAILRMHRRPSQSDWESIGLDSIPPDVREAIINEREVGS